MSVKKEDFAEWLLHPVTRELRARFEADVERLKDAWARGEFANNPVADAKVRGQVEVLTQFFTLDSDDVETE